MTKSGRLEEGASQNAEVAQNTLTVNRQPPTVLPYPAGPATHVSMDDAGESPPAPALPQHKSSPPSSTPATAPTYQARSTLLLSSDTSPLDFLSTGSTFLARTRMRALSEASGSLSRRGTEFGTGRTTSRPESLGLEEERSVHGAQAAGVEEEVARLERDLVCRWQRGGVTFKIPH